jgi:hypothetical protein
MVNADETNILHVSFPVKMMKAMAHFVHWFYNIVREHSSLKAQLV